MEQKPPQIPLELHPALQIFIRELDHHIQIFEKNLNELETEEQEASTGSEKRASLEHRFHTIRGGASFLGLQGIREAATFGEETFRPNAASVQSRETLKDKLKRIINTLSKELSQLRNI